MITVTSDGLFLGGGLEHGRHGVGRDGVNPDAVFRGIWKMQSLFRFLKRSPCLEARHRSQEMQDLFEHLRFLQKAADCQARG
jgi:hypothetical protein